MTVFAQSDLVGLRYAISAYPLSSSLPDSLYHALRIPAGEGELLDSTIPFSHHHPGVANGIIDQPPLAVNQPQADAKATIPYG